MLRRFDGPVEEANAVARALCEDLRRFEEVADVVPGARTVLVELQAGAEPSDALMRSLNAQPRNAAARPAPTHEVRVTYDGADLRDVARLAHLSENEVVSLHSSAEYVVAFIGFQPGFPYLLGLPEELACPRLDTPRSKVPRGSVAIGGAYAGIYPAESPGGWRLIGTTDIQLFDQRRDQPSLFVPGDRVRFVPV
jgi:KipI family sensor histidine kinase inhibitor